jgi:predicted O-linked N-acetylglucosamine transferase (SPINDLY family)
MKTAQAILEEATARLLAGATDEAVKLLRAARRKHPRHGALAGRYADALHASGDLPAALAAYDTALALDPDLAQAWYGLGSAQLELKAFGAAARALAKAVDLSPRHGPSRYGLGKACFELGLADAALGHFRQARQSDDPELAALAAESIACIIPGAASANGAAVLRERRAWMDLAGSLGEPPAARPPAGRRLKIGYLSAHFGEANWMKPVFGVINHHDRAKVEVHMISDGKPPSGASGYRDWPDDRVYGVRGVGDDRLARVLRDIGLDVLVDLSGYSYARRMPMLARRPAPVILGWFNHFATSGTAAVDALLGDAAVIDPREDDGYVERRIALPGSYLAFSVDYPVPDVAPAPSSVTGPGVTFGCLGSQYKLDEAVLRAWARILAGAPATRLFLKNAALEDASTRDHLRARLERLGVAAERVEFAGRSPHYDFLAAYARVDIALDTFPYNGGTTTTEALWQGVPVLAFDGDRWAGRTSKSILLAAGMGDWLMADEAAYVRRAIDLANDPATPGRLATLRSGMRAALRASPACDVAGLSRALEAVYDAEVARAAAL